MGDYNIEYENGDGLFLWLHLFRWWLVFWFSFCNSYSNGLLFGSHLDILNFYCLSGLSFMEELV